MRTISFLSITRTVEVSPLVEDIRSLILCSTKLPHHKAVSEKDTRSSHKCVARRAKGVISPKCSENMVIMCIARCFSKQNNVFPRRSNILALQNCSHPHKFGLATTVSSQHKAASHNFRLPRFVSNVLLATFCELVRIKL